MSTDKTFHVEIITPERLTYSEDVNILVVNGVEGQMGLLHNHAPILALLDAGPLMVRSRGQEIHMAVGRGFVKMSHNRAVCLVEFAERAEDIDVAGAQKQRAALEQEMASAPAAERERLRHRMKALQARIDIASRKGA